MLLLLIGETEVAIKGDCWAKAYTPYPRHCKAVITKLGLWVTICLKVNFKWSQTPAVLKRNLKHIFIIKHSVLTNSRCVSFSSISVTYNFSCFYCNALLDFILYTRGISEFSLCVCSLCKYMYSQTWTVDFRALLTRRSDPSVLAQSVLQRDQATFV